MATRARARQETASNGHAASNLPEAEIQTLATLRGLGPEGMREAYLRGLLSFETFRGQRAWRFADDRNGCLRRLDGRPWDGRKPAKALQTRDGTPNWPVGLLETALRDRREMLLCEGAPDALTAYYFANLEGTLRAIGVAAMMGAKHVLAREALEMFRGRFVRIIAHADESGQEAADRWARQLAAFAAGVQVFDLCGLSTPDGAKAKDLNDVAYAGADDFEANRDLRAVTRLGDCGPRVRKYACTPTLNLGAVTQDAGGLFQPGPRVAVTQETQDTQETQETQEGREEEKRKSYGPSKTSARKKGRAGDHVSAAGEANQPDAALLSLSELLVLGQACRCTQRDTARPQLFDLAREVRGHEVRFGGKLSFAALQEIFNAWYNASLPALDPAKREDEYFAAFVAAIPKVRCPRGSGGGTLKTAIERAARIPAPQIPGYPRAPQEWLRIASLHRELQREAGEASYFLTAGAAAEFAGLGYRIQAHRITEALERAGLVQLVRRGSRKLANGYRWLGPIPEI